MQITATGPQFNFLTSSSDLKCFVGGIGSGKTTAGVLQTLKEGEHGTTGLVVAPTYKMINDVILEEFFEWAEDAIVSFHKQDKIAHLKSGAKVLFRSAQNPDNLRGPNIGFAWIDEAAMIDKKVFDIILGRVRIDPGKIYATTTPKGNNWVSDSFDEYIRAKTYDNPHLPDSYIERLEKQYTEEFRRQELQGEFVSMGGTLVDFSDIKRPDSIPDYFDRVAIGVDPAGGGASETGIVVVGKSGEQAYVLADYSTRGNPSQWASAVATAWNQEVADVVVAERNYGGDMVKSTIHTINKDINVEKVNASRGKRKRAEPIAAMYEQGRVFHNQRLEKLESQLTNWNPEADDGENDRLDALVWAITELLIEERAVGGGTAVAI